MYKIFKTIAFVLFAALSFAACDDVPAPYDDPNNKPGNPSGGEEEIITPKGSGTLADPYNVAGLLDFIEKNEDTAKGTTVVVEAVISSIKSLDVAQYTRAQYYINDTKSTTGQFYVYNGLYLNGENFTANDQIKVGDKVLIEGTIDQYNGAFQIGQNSKILKLNDEGGADEPGGEVTPGSEVTCAEARNIALALDDKASTAETYTVVGYITKVVGDVSRNQQSFWMADTKDGGEVFEAYWADLPAGVTEFVVGSKVKITGQIMRYGDTPEIKNASVEIVELGGGDTPGGDEPGTTEPSGDGAVSVNGTTVTLTNAAVAAGSEGVTMVVEELGLDDKAGVDGMSFSFSDGTTVSLAKGEGTTAPTYYAATKGFRVYACNTLTFSANKTIAKIVMECDLYKDTSYVGNETATFSVEGNTAVYNNYNEEKKGGVQLRPQKITVYYAK